MMKALNYGTTEGIYKTEWCLVGPAACPYGSLCNFAHSLAELQPRIQDELYKSVNCKNGPDCRFGSKCKYRHNRDFCLWITDTTNFLVIDRTTGSKRLVQVVIRANGVTVAESGLFDLALTCSKELLLPAVQTWVRFLLSLP